MSRRDISQGNSRVNLSVGIWQVGKGYLCQKAIRGSGQKPEKSSEVKAVFPVGLRRSHLISYTAKRLSPENPLWQCSAYIMSWAHAI